MALLVLLSDRAPEAALPALADLRFDLKVEPLSVDSLAHVRELEPAAAMVDAGENPGQAWSVLQAIQAVDSGLSTLAMLIGTGWIDTRGRTSWTSSYSPARRPASNRAPRGDAPPACGRERRHDHPARTIFDEGLVAASAAAIEPSVV